MVCDGSSFVGLLNCLSTVLETSIEKLLDLEKESLKELENRKNDLAIQSKSHMSPQYPCKVKIKEEPLGDIIALSSDHINSAGKSNLRGVRLVPESKLLRKDLIGRESQGMYVDKDERIWLKRKSESDFIDEESFVPEVCSAKIMKLSPGMVTDKKEVEISETGNQESDVFSPEVSATVLNYLKSYSNSKCLQLESCSITVKKEKDEDETKSDSMSYIPRLGINSVSRTVKCEKDFYMAMIKFKTSFSYSEALQILSQAGVKNVNDICLTEMEAIITFHNKEDWKVLMNLANKQGMKKIKATKLEAYKRPHSS